MQRLLPTILLVTGLVSLSHAQIPIHPDSIYTEGITYLDGGIGTYGFEVAASGEPVGKWGAALFLRAYPGPKGSLYSLDSDFIAGAKIKYYGWFPEGFYAGPMVGGLVSGSIRPWAGAALGYDFYTYYSDRSEFKNIHVGFDIQGGMDTKGDGFIGLGVRFGVGFKSGDKPFSPD